MQYSIIVDTRSIVPFILYVDGKPTDREVKKLVKEELMTMIDIKVGKYRKDDIDLIDCIDMNESSID